jgi:hypothetical protein
MNAIFFIICIIYIFYVLFFYKMYVNLILVYKWCICTMTNKNKFSLSIFWFCHLCRATASKYLDLEAHLGKLHLHLKFVLASMKWPHPTIQLHFQLMLCTYNHTNCNVNEFPKNIYVHLHLACSFQLTEHVHVSFGHWFEVNVSLCAWSTVCIYMTVYVLRGQ